MPTDVKAAVSAVVILVALGLAFWSGSPIRPEFDKFVLFTAVFFVVAMWIFPEAGGKKGAVRNASLAVRKRSRNLLWSPRCVNEFALKCLSRLLMFNKKTVLILGAGASAEFDMPVGSQLMSQIAEMIRFRNPNSDPHFRGRMSECLGAERTARLLAVCPRTLITYPEI